jgi:hypothetical protein
MPISTYATNTLQAAPQIQSKDRHSRMPSWSYSFLLGEWNIRKMMSRPMSRRGRYWDFPMTYPILIFSFYYEFYFPAVGLYLERQCIRVSVPSVNEICGMVAIAILGKCSFHQHRSKKSGSFQFFLYGDDKAS